MKKAKFYTKMAAALLGLTMSSVVALAQSVPVVYFMDSMAEYDGYSALYRVDMSSGAPVLELMPNGILPYNNLDAIACEPDGSILWMIDDMSGGTTDTGLLLAYFVADGSVQQIGVLTRNGKRLMSVDQATCAPDGTLYIGHNNSDTILTVDKTTAVATPLGTVVTTNFNPAGVAVDIQGGDLTFSADGVFYLYSYFTREGAPRGVYTLRLPPENGVVYAEYLGGPATGERLSGLAVLDEGLGNLIGSVTRGSHPDTFIIMDRATGGQIAYYPMTYNGQPMPHEWGDMTTGPLWHEETNYCTYTIGYWKTHPWDGRVVTVLGVAVDEALGKQILWNASDRNVSMFLAQLIAAKLNVDNSSRIRPVSDAEGWLDEWDAEFCPVVIPDGQGGLTLDWNRRFCSDDEKMLMTYWKDLLDQFNNSNPCEEEEEPPPEFCTYTIGYWKNHSWEGRVVTILGIPVDETFGKLILKWARGNNLSMFFAQLIAAKLNVNNSYLIPPVNEAEEWLSQWNANRFAVVVPDGQGGYTLDWNRPFASAEERQLMTSWKDALDEFNNTYHCEDGQEKPPCDGKKSGHGGPGGGHGGGSGGGHGGGSGCGGGRGAGKK